VAGYWWGNVGDVDIATCDAGRYNSPETRERREALCRTKNRQAYIHYKLIFTARKQEKLVLVTKVNDKYNICHY